MQRLSRLFALLLVAATDTVADTVPADTVITPLLEQALEGIAGKVATVVTVEYAPGASTPPHTHPAHTIVYVLHGAIEMQVAGGPRVTLTSGQTYYERPSDVHVVSRNASSTESAKFLVVFIKDKEADLLVPVAPAGDAH